MAEYFPGFVPESDSEDDDDESLEKKASKKAERRTSKEPRSDDKPEKKEREDAVPLERLADDEKSAIAAELARLRAEAAKNEVIEAADGSLEQTEAIPVVEFDEALQQNLEEGQTFEEALENAEATAIDLLGEDVAVEATDDYDNTEAIVDEGDQHEDEDDGVMDSAATTSSSGAGSSHSSTNAGASSGGGGTGSGTGAGGGNGIGGSGGGTGSTGGGAGGQGAGGTNHPPIGGGPAAPSPGNPGPASPNAYQPNVSANANLAPTDTTEQQSASSHLLVGGIVGYLIGRRRGRIKTERRLLPIQKKLEKQVTGLEKQIAVREEKIRSLTRRQAEVQPALQATMAERKQAQKTSSKEQVKKVSQQQKVASEKLGKLVFARETPTRESQTRESPAQGTPEQRTKSVDLMTLPELLRVADRVKIEDGTVKRLFETGRLDERGMRRILKAYLSGEPYERVLREQLRSAEIRSLEQDPVQPMSQQSQQTTQAIHAQESNSVEPNHTPPPQQRKDYSAPSTQHPFESNNPVPSPVPKNRSAASSLVTQPVVISVVVVVSVLIVLLLLLA